MAEFEKINLEKKADDFIIQNFWATRSIENEMIGFYLKSHRKVWTMLPRDVDEKVITGFPWSYMIGDASLLFDYVPVLLNIFNSDSNLELISFDNVSESNEDPQKISTEFGNLTQVFFYNETVFHWLPRNLINKENLESGMNIGFYPTLEIFTILNDRIKKNIVSNQIDSEDVNFIISNIKYIVIGAYDEEGCLIVEFDNQQ